MPRLAISLKRGVIEQEGLVPFFLLPLEALHLLIGAGETREEQYAVANRVNKDSQPAQVTRLRRKEAVAQPIKRLAITQ
jgi:hypothetical protein